jgi:hypothetical protein
LVSVGVFAFRTVLQLAKYCAPMASSSEHRASDTPDQSDLKYMIEQVATEHLGTSTRVRENLGLIPIVEVAFNSDMWWSIPEEISRQLYENYSSGLDAGYTWDWGPDGRRGSWQPDDIETRINRYKIDFVNMVQTNIDNERKRSVRIVWVRPEDVLACFTGELP